MKAEIQLIEIAQRQHSLLSKAQALRHVGLATWERAHDKGLWLQVAPGWYRHAATPLTMEMQVRAGSKWLGDRGALYGSTALWWLGVAVPQPAQADFLVPRGLRFIPPWMNLHTTLRWSNDDITRHRGIRTTVAARAILDFASQRPSVREVEAAIDDAVHLRRTALPRLRARLGELRGRGRHGCALVAELLLDSGGESLLERRFLRLVREAGLPRPECQVAMRADDTTVARVDFRFPQTNVVVEVSGRLGHTSDRDRQRDARRRNRLQELGQRIIEFTTADVIGDPLYVVATLRKHLPVMSQPRSSVVAA